MQVTLEKPSAEEVEIAEIFVPFPAVRERNKSLPWPMCDSLDAAMDFLNRAYQVRETVALALAGAGPMHCENGMLRESFAACCETLAADCLRLASALRA